MAEGGGARGLQHRFVITGEQPLRRAAVGLDHAVGLEAAFDPGLLLGGAGHDQRPHLGAQRRLHRRGLLAAAHPGAPDLVQAVQAA